MTVEPYKMTPWTKEKSDKLKAAWSEALRNGLDALAKMVEQHESAERERDTLVRMLSSEFDWSDTSYLHAMLHVENAIRNLRADARAAQAERDEATIKLKFIETEYEKANASELTRDALALQNAALVARCETLRQLADSAAAEQGLANRRMMQAQAERDQLREELARLHRLAPIGTYTVSLPHEQEIQRLSGEKYTWQARAELAEEAANGLREALRAAEKRELQSLAELNEREADVETLQTHVEVQREALQKTSKAVAKLVVHITKIQELLTENGCDCECEHCWEDHDEDCERCLACRISMAIQKEENHD